MPLPGDCFVLAAQARGDSGTEIVDARKDKKTIRKVNAGPGLKSVIRRCLYGCGEFKITLPVKGRGEVVLDVIPGHKWGHDPHGPAAGPEPCEVMVIGKMHGDMDGNFKRCFRGKPGQHLMNTCKKLNINGIAKWYVTNILKTEDPTDGEGAVTSYCREFEHLLWQEIKLVKPKYILCLSADALKALFGKSMTQTAADNRVLDLKVPMHKSEKDEPEFLNIQVMNCVHPAAVLSEPSLEPKFERTLNRFNQLIHGNRWDEKEKGLDHRVIKDEVALRKLIKEMKANNKNRIVAIDAEWDGSHPQNKGSYVRCVQVSWAHKKAAVIELTEPGGEPSFKRLVGLARDARDTKNLFKTRLTTAGGGDVAMRLLGAFLSTRRLAGHFINSDFEQLLPWWERLGIDVLKRSRPTESWLECRTKGGLDTALMAHSANECDEFELNAQVANYTSAPRYDILLDEWKKSSALKRRKAASQPDGDPRKAKLQGYGDCPSEILYPYAAYDADVTRRIAMVHMKRLDCDEFGNNCWEAYWISWRASFPVLEINTTGLVLDSKRVQELTTLFMSKRDALRQQIREWFKWPDLNLESVFHVRELLFGEHYNRVEVEEKGKVERLRPLVAKSLRAMPLLTTGKRPKAWDDVVADGDEDAYTPSTNKSALGIMIREADKLRVMRKGRYVRRNYLDQIGWLRDYRFVNQVLKSTLRPPLNDPSTKSVMLDEEGEWVYGAGIAGSICGDRRIRTFISQLMETGRWSSSRPPLQNISKRREAEYKRILGSDYQCAIRSIFMAPPGCVFIEADFKGAELYGMAIMSGDEVMIQHAVRGLLDENDPNYYDIHSNIAVLAFRFTCPPTKAGLESIGKAHMRIVAKSVVFGIAYGRGAKAIALAAREDGVNVTIDEAQQIIDTVFAMYPKLQPFFEECRARAVNQKAEYGEEHIAPRWLCNCYGRYRRFGVAKERQLMGDFEREAMNFPIQSMIADAMSHAIYNVWQYRNDQRMDFKIVLQIHDALLLQVPYAEVPHVIDYVLPEVMCKSVPIWPCKLDGSPLECDSPYYLGVDKEVSTNWGDMMFPDQHLALGVDPKYSHWRYLKKRQAWKHETKSGPFKTKDGTGKVLKLWRDGRWFEEAVAV